MHTPTKAHWQVVIDKLKSILPMAKHESNFDMGQGRVNCFHKCGTVHCVGGWYAIASGLHNMGPVDYEDGADFMAADLGFKQLHPSVEAKELLRDWAYENCHIWGNHSGYSMFSDEAAYGYAKDMQGVITYLEGVKDRSPE
jgi:hypothetical protein